MKFSIITPVYNTSEYLDECIKSVVNQDYVDFEYILIDDGSDDGSEAICDEWAAKDNRIVVEHQIHSGAAVARNKGLELASGDYILFIDSDDYWLESNVLSLINARLTETAPDVLCFNYCKEYSNNTLSKAYYSAQTMPVDSDSDYIFDFFLKNHIWGASSCNKAVKRELIDSNFIRYTPDSVAEDIEWCFNLMVYSDRIDYINDVILSYRQHEGSSSKTITFEKIQSVCDILCNLKNELSSVDGYKNAVLTDYLGYLTASLLADVSKLKNVELSKEFVSGLNELMSSFNDVYNKKAKLVFMLERRIGLKGVIFLLKIFYK